MEIKTEIDSYGEVRRLLPMYTLFLGKVCQLNLDSVNRAINSLPQGSDFMHGFYRDAPRAWVWHFRSTYFEFSETNRFSRSWLLASLAEVIQKLKDVKQQLTQAQQELQRANHARLYTKLLVAYDTWHTLAAPRLTVSQSAFLKREQVGRGGGARVKGRRSRPPVNFYGSAARLAAMSDLLRIPDNHGRNARDAVRPVRLHRGGCPTSPPGAQ